MSQDLPNNENTLTLDLGTNPVTPVAAAATPKAASVLSAPAYTAKSKVQPALTSKIICYDTETTGTDPWDYRLLGCSFWDLSKPVATMETFFDFDEEKVTRDIAEYLNREKPDIMVQYNNGFDERALLTRFMLYQVPVPGWNGIEQVDVMDILKKGTTQSIGSSQATGSEEQWLLYFFNESKPYSIYECFEGIRDNDLTRIIIRNRTCVESEGSLYLLFRYVTDVEQLNAPEAKPTVVNIDEMSKEGKVLEVCPTCSAVNELEVGSKNNTCWRCLGSIPDPDANNILKEILRTYDFSKVGSTMKADKPLPIKESGVTVLK